MMSEVGGLGLGYGNQLRSINLLLSVPVLRPPTGLVTFKDWIQSYSSYFFTLAIKIQNTIY